MVRPWRVPGVRRRQVAGAFLNPVKAAAALAPVKAVAMNMPNPSLNRNPNPNPNPSPNPQAGPSPQGRQHGPWRASMLLASPHRLGFALALAVLLAASGWWLAVQVDRASGVLGLPVVVSPTLTHAAVMVFGFMPLYFAGFLFTAGPKWLGVAPIEARALVPALGLQALGWLLWLAGAHGALALAVGGLWLAVGGLAWMMVCFGRLIGASQAADQMHARTVAVAGWLGVLALAGVAWATAAHELALALVVVRTGLWAFVVVVYVTVAHRMLPFFTANVVRDLPAWRPRWLLALLLAVAGWQVLAVWVDWWAPPPRAWTLACVVVEGAQALALAALSWRWGLWRSRGNRLLAMLHIGFAWLALTLGYSAVSQALWLASGQPLLGLGAVHALGMGFLGSLMVAMVSRVSCGHGGLPLRADGLTWGLFWGVQAATVLRLLAALQGMAPGWVLAAAALWLAVMALWGWRYGPGYGQPRADGKPG